MWASRGFCDSLFYPEHVKRRYCALSCKYCRPQVEEEEQIPERPFADDPTSKEHTRKHHHKTTTLSPKESEEELMPTTESSKKEGNGEKKLKAIKKEDE
jgi:hypothetical protein